MTHEEALLEGVRCGRRLSVRERISLVFRLSLPAMMAEVSAIIMQYIDAAMVGRLGAGAAASIGLVSSTIWLLWGMSRMTIVGFSIQTGQEIGARRYERARSIMKQGFAVTLGFSLLAGLLGAAISSRLPFWLGGSTDLSAIAPDATRYFLVIALTLPLYELNYLACDMLQASGNMRLPSALNILACSLDVVFNALLIFPSRVVHPGPFALSVPGAGLGVAGAALGTVGALSVSAIAGAWFLLMRSDKLRLRAGEPLRFSRAVITRAVRISAPVAFETITMRAAYIAFTCIVAPLGAIAIAANSFAVTAEGLCYMPGYGIGAASTALVAQSVGARRRGLAKDFAWISTAMGVIVMTITGTIMFFTAHWMMALLTPDPAIQAAGAEILRIEALAEPLFAVSIVAAGALRGAGDTFVPSMLNIISVWCVRVPMAAFLASRIGLRGAWIAMASELCVRGLFMFGRLRNGAWLRNLKKPGFARAA